MALPIHVAAVQYATEDGNHAANTDHAIHLLDTAMHTSDLVLLPDMSFTCSLKPDDLRSHAQPARGPITTIVRQIAVDRNACACFCIPERDGDRIYKTAMLVCADGGIIGRQRKLHLHPDEADAGFSAGDVLNLLTCYLGKIGVLIGDDAFDVKNAVALANQGAQVLLVPSVAVADQADDMDATIRKWEDALRACASKSGCFVVWANKIGADLGKPAVGNSMIISPDGKIIARADMMEEVVRTQITLMGIARAA